MEKIEKIEGVIYTQNKNLPINERIFFAEGMVSNKNDYRIATEQELKDKEEYERIINQEYESEEN